MASSPERQSRRSTDILAIGSKKMVEFAVRRNKSCRDIYCGQVDAAQALRDFIADNEIATLNVAGPRASEEPEVGEFVRKVLEEAYPARLV